MVLGRVIPFTQLPFAQRTSRLVARASGLAFLSIGFACGGGISLAQSASSGESTEATLRVGIVHSAPHLCVGQEPGQRDLWVLHLAYGVALAPSQRMAWPWYVVPTGRDLALQADGLWGTGGNGAAGSGGTSGVLARWLDAVQARIPALRADPAALAATTIEPGRMPVLSVRLGQADPWIASRMNGSALLPYRDEFGVGRPCRSWPSGIEFLPGRAALEGGRIRYVLRRKAVATPTNSGRPTLPPMALSGYGTASALWQDFNGGRVDVALVDGEALRQQEPASGRWHAQPGTQQVILRWNPKLAGALAPDARQILSQAINRPALAGAAGRGGFRAARAFFDPVLPYGRAGEAESLHWDSRLARKQWLASAGSGLDRRLRMAVLAHPLLETIARRLAGQWQATLGLAAVPELVEADRIVQAWNGGTYDLMLDVVDLDDGSLQDLWRDSLGSVGQGALDPPTSSQLASWETVLRKSLPYLPLLTGMQYFLPRSDAAAESLRALCPACVPVATPSGEENP